MNFFEDLKKLKRHCLLPICYARGNSSACMWNGRNTGHFSGCQISGTFELSIRDTEIKIFYTGKYPFPSITSVLLELDCHYLFSRYFIYWKMQLCRDCIYLQIEVNSGKTSLKKKVLVLYFQMGTIFFRVMFSQNHGIVEVGKNIWRTSGPTSMLMQSHLGQVAQGQVQTTSEYLHGWRPHNVPRPPVSVPSHLPSKKLFPDVQMDPPVFLSWFQLGEC